jgi:lipopolysaccharide/colanic/teichoic acid biosynthesis glycosyltransferase
MYVILKRTMAVGLALSLLVVLSPLMAIIAMLVWLDSPGNVIFSQDRIGYMGKIFKIYKFRKFPSHWKAEGPSVTARRDPRMTPVGMLLERTKLDELPQLWNILKGDMTFVGPRPECLRFRDLYRGEYKKLLSFVPGIFGPNQILFRNECEWYRETEEPEAFYRKRLFPQKAENDLRYFERTNLFMDMVTMLCGGFVSIFGIVNWRRFFRYNLWVVVLDFVLISIAWVAAYIARFADIPEGENLAVMVMGLRIVPLLMVAGLLFGGVYRCPMRYFTLANAVRLGLVVCISWPLVFILLVGLQRCLSLYIVPITGSFFILFLIFPRALSRWRWEKSISSDLETGGKVLIYGAGRTGLALAGCLCRTWFIGFIDDNPDVIGNQIRGLPVLGNESHIATIHLVHPFKELWVTFVPAQTKRERLEAICSRLQVKMTILPEFEPIAQMRTARSSTPIDVPGNEGLPAA